LLSVGYSALGEGSIELLGKAIENYDMIRSLNLGINTDLLRL